jgi:branched-chain amino acid transport system ATP-binding protein
MSGPLLEVRDLRRSFGGVHAVDGVSFAVEPGTISGLIGPNGAGKSTALGMIAGAIKPSGGSIAFDGHDVTGASPMRLGREGLIRTFQISSEFQRLTVLENLLVGAPAHAGALRDAGKGRGVRRQPERWPEAPSGDHAVTDGQPEAPSP